nr:NAD(P)H-binding protein [Geodermatophilaceae bacterium]
GLKLHAADATDTAQLASLIGGHDAVISATTFRSSDAKKLIAALKQAGVPRLLVVGGAGSLEVAPGKALVLCHA